MPFGGKCRSKIYNFVKFLKKNHINLRTFWYVKKNDPPRINEIGTFFCENCIGLFEMQYKHRLSLCDGISDLWWFFGVIRL